MPCVICGGTLSNLQPVRAICYYCMTRSDALYCRWLDWISDSSARSQNQILKSWTSIEKQERGKALPCYRRWDLEMMLGRKEVQKGK